MIMSNANISRFVTQAKGASFEELNCLYWVAQGKSAEVIAMILGKAKSTVDGQIYNLRQKLNTQNRCHLVAECFKYRLLAFDANQKLIVNTEGIGSDRRIFCE